VIIIGHDEYVGDMDMRGIAPVEYIYAAISRTLLFLQLPLHLPIPVEAVTMPEAKDALIYNVALRHEKPQWQTIPKSYFDRRSVCHQQAVDT
jgi:hypothetical protein